MRSSSHQAGVPKGPGPAHLSGELFCSETVVTLPDTVADYSAGLTLELWAELETPKSKPVRLFQVGSGSSSGSNSVALVQVGATIEAQVDGHMKASTSSITTGEWNHLALTIAPTGELTLYLNGHSASSTNVPTPGLLSAIGSSQKTFLGPTRKSNPRPLACAVADARIWSCARTADEIKTAMARCLTGNEHALVACWPLDGTGRNLTGRQQATISNNAVGATVPLADAYTMGEAFIGELADVQIWSIARLPKDVAATMYVAPSSVEGLAARYPLGGLLFGDTTTTPDVSAGMNDAAVKGSPHVGSMQLPATLANSRPVVKYSNDELVAVVQRGRYEESFEFKPIPSSSGSTSADWNAVQSGQKLFEFDVWGKSSRGSDEVVKIDPPNVTQEAFVALGDGWYRAKCQFTVPEGIRMLRSFGIHLGASPSVGGWTSIDVRKHRLKQLTDTTTKSSKARHAPLSSLGSSSASQLSSLRDEEARQCAIRAEIANLSFRLSVARQIAYYQNELQAYKSHIVPDLSAEIPRIQERISSLESAWTNFYYRIKVSSFSRYLQPEGRRAERGATLVSAFEVADDPYQKWQFRPLDSIDGVERFRIESWNSGLFLTALTPGTNNLVKLQEMNPSFDASGRNPQVWYRWIRGDGAIAFAIYGYWHRGEGTHCWLNLWDGRTADESTVGTLGWVDGGWYFFSLEKGDYTADAAEELQSLRSSLARAQSVLAHAREHITVLERLVANRQPVDKLRELLRAAEGRLSTSLQHYNNASQNYLAQFAGARALSMPLLATDDRGLTTRGASLGFVEPVGRPSLVETCEGNVALIYSNERGHVQQAIYDATADSRNAAFEQWLAPTGRTAVRLGSTGATLADSVEMPERGTLEAWFQYPLPVDEGQDAEPSIRPFASSQDGRQMPLAVVDGDQLGVVSDGRFFDSGVRLSSTLAPGWHHAAVVQKPGATEIFLDGIKVATLDQHVAAIRLHVDGQKMVVAAPHETTASSGGLVGLTFAVWVKSEAADWSGTNLIKVDGRFRLVTARTGSDNVLRLVVDGNTHADPEIVVSDVEKWHLCVCIFNGVSSELCLIDSSAPVRSDVVLPSLRPLGDVEFGSKVENRERNPIQIAEPRIWTRDLAVAELRRLLLEDGDGADVGVSDIYGQWTFNGAPSQSSSEEGQVQGWNVSSWMKTSPQARLKASPEVVVVSPLCQGEIRSLGGSANGQTDASIGCLAEVRIWGVPLTETEVAAHGRVGLTGSEPGLLHYWSCGEKSGADVYDLVPEGHRHANIGGSGQHIACLIPLGASPTRVRSFNGLTSYVKLAWPAAAGDGAAAPLVVAFWVCATVATECVVLELGENSLEIDSSGCWALSSGRGNGGNVRSDVGPTVRLGVWSHVVLVLNAGGGRDAYIDGTPFSGSSVVAGSGLRVGLGTLQLGKGTRDLSMAAFRGQIAHVAVYRGRIDSADIASLARPPRGDEEHLVGYWPLDDDSPAESDGASGAPVENLVSSDADGPLSTAYDAVSVLTMDLTSRRGADAMAGEYSTVCETPEGKKSAIMRRFFASVSAGQVEVVPDLRVEELDLKWIGNMQLDPALLGYIEGAPPVPSENLTVEGDYRNATSVTLSQSEEVSYSWDRSEQSELTVDLDGFLGAAWRMDGGIGLVSRISEGQAGAAFNYSHRKEESSGSSVAAESIQKGSDTISLTGAQEQRTRFAKVGARYVPKNVGYALVISGLADVFISTLKRSGRMVGYDIRPVEGVPLDINTITFMINPAYVMNGSLDGLVGSEAADSRFYGHVPEMRSQYGSLYPASYYRLKEAYDIKAKIAQKDKDRESYFANYDVASQAYLDIEKVDDADTGAGGGVRKDASEEDAEAQAEEQGKTAKDEAAKRKEEIAKRYKVDDVKVRATGAFEDWQRRMERLQIKAGKRNIVNTYVWDGDGGLRVESESFANTIEHSLGSMMYDGGGAGLDTDFAVSSFKAALRLLVGGSKTTSQTKTMSATKAVELTVDLLGVEGKGITDLQDRPLVPGEKVDRYRFMTFFLEDSTDHFHTFFNEVVDPEWLASNDEEARALRQTQAGRPNSCWRVLHRVTYVERPALSGLGTDTRPVAFDAVPPSDGEGAVSQYFERLAGRHHQLVGRMTLLESKLEEILTALRSNVDGSDGSN
ncbi:MAG: LamG-like jellyroll fold domain-containing protein [Nannocystaceae bacterium]